MKTQMLSIQNATLFFLGAMALASSGCVGSGESSDESDPARGSERPAAEASHATKVERLSRKVDVGDGPSAIADLAAARADTSATVEERDQASLSLARALEAKGDMASAEKTLEDLIAAHGFDHDWPLSDTAEAAFRKLLTGNEEAPRAPNARTNDAPTSSFARALAKYFPERNGSNDILIHAFGGSSDVTERLGTFNIGRAIREMKDEACPLCDVTRNVNTSSHRTGDFLGIPKAGSAIEGGLVVYYYALDGRRIPARYESLLPLSIANIEARLARGEGVAAVKERPGAAPAILIAAPRFAELADVEEVLSERHDIPAEPITVQVKTGLRPEEIRQIVSASKKDQRACYKTLIETAPSAEGTVTLKLEVGKDGAVGEVTTEATPGVRDADFLACMQGVAQKLVFPATGYSGKVVFPVRVASSR